MIQEVWGSGLKSENEPVSLRGVVQLLAPVPAQVPAKAAVLHVSPALASGLFATC